MKYDSGVCLSPNTDDLMADEGRAPLSNDRSASATASKPEMGRFGLRAVDTAGMGRAVAEGAAAGQSATVGWPPLKVWEKC
jgi:hypothetical protein